MPTYKIRGIDVDFPYEAYDCQLVYMEKVIQSLQNKCNALLESPTGTGKTLCLLCATLAWRKSLGEFSRGRSERSNIRGSQCSDDDMPKSQSSSLPAIIYTSRTHSQIRQVVQELKRSYYRPKMVVLGSREQLCIHEQVSLLRGKAQTNACHALCKKRTKQYCAHFSRVTEFAKKNPGIGDDPIDIEDLVNIGKSSGPCPYYLSREIHKDVDILFAPYNYLIDRGNRKSLKIDWSNSILIFDEAHNLEGLCADAASFDLPSSLLTACISEAKKCVDLSVTRRDVSSDKSCNPDDFAILGALLSKLEKRIAEVHIESKDLGFTKPGPYIYELLSELNITQKTADMLMDIVEKACALLEEDASTSESGGSHKTSGTFCRLESMGDILRLIFRDDKNAHAHYYRVHVQEVEDSGPDVFRGKNSRTLSWWCFNPGISMEEFAKLGVGSIILTSGTLSPMDSFAEELKLDFPIRLENPHVISDNQIWAGVAPVGPSGYSFNSSYRSRGSIEYKTELGNAIDGLLVFFPSYYLLEQCISCWKTMGQQNLSTSTTIWERICKHKLPVVEPRQSSLFPMAIEDYMTKLKGTCSSGAVFFAVCRGKVSEGLDFADHAGRAVVVTGLPFATMTDAKVRLKREYLDQQTQSRKIGIKGLTGEEWYTQQASRAVNQAVGRVIRHKHDYGAIIFCDERRKYHYGYNLMSKYVSLFLSYSKFGDVVYTLTRFFRDAGTHCRPKLELTRDAGLRGRPKLEMTQNEDQETARLSQSSQPVGKFHPEKLLTPQMTAVDRSGSTGSSSSTKLVKQGDIFIDLRKIVPANRSHLISDKMFNDSIFKCSNDPTRTGKDPLVNLQDSNDEKGDVAASCILGKHSLLITGPDQPKHDGKSDHHFLNLVKKKKLQLSENVSIQSPREKEVSQAIPHNNEETKGSAFLSQVRQKLTDTEYKEFVGFMKALKSKSMKIGPVLQSIARLFSAPDRLPLLHGYQIFTINSSIAVGRGKKGGGDIGRQRVCIMRRVVEREMDKMIMVERVMHWKDLEVPFTISFKEYVPAKYHSLYEHFLCANSNAAGV
ncbi:regulator of telomere elongation helicase 1 [Phtheirospermum japonicum]|uniref:Regulator of telomere elongation helicase 1 homolog n=1 Tax=Phtheirospermum japonicum TaxID=374723 RepID=A0A830BV98_9LAMI|nr:regulator of telomere elongation helicase 1 [Phtheirospermum japonicum]